jgi:endogenous inhibitor of DNA gyrase (YacG/DUF329 family)
MSTQPITPASLVVSPDEKNVTKLICKMPGCRNPVEQKATGRPREFCSNACKQAWYRKPTADEKLAQRNERTYRINKYRGLDATGFGGYGGVGDAGGVPRARDIRIVDGKVLR